jgi:hypothetical protein
LLGAVSRLVVLWYNILVGIDEVDVLIGVTGRQEVLGPWCPLLVISYLCVLRVLVVITEYMLESESTIVVLLD